MLGKVLKYDLKRMYKFLLIFYTISIAVAVITGVISKFDSFVGDILKQIFIGITVSAIANIIINNFMRLWILFKQELYGDEAYLRHTLPVKIETLYLSKMILSILTIITSTVMVILTLILSGIVKFQMVKDFFNSFSNSVPLAEFGGLTFGIFITVIILVCMLQFTNIVLSGYIGIIIGHKFNRGKILLSVIYGFVTYGIVQASILGISYIIGLFDSNIMASFTSDVIAADTTKKLMFILMILYTVFIGLFALAGTKFLKKGVDVE